MHRRRQAGSRQAGAQGAGRSSINHVGFMLSVTEVRCFAIPPPDFAEPAHRALLRYIAKEIPDTLFLPSFP